MSATEPTDKRVLFATLSNGQRIYLVTLVGGVANGLQSLCSGNVTYRGGEKYVRGEDDRYYHEPQAGARS
jgi:hypothetical protein